MLFYLIMGLFIIPLTNENNNDRPNILWITTEDHGPHLGAYGDQYAHTPVLDAFAEQSLRFDRVWSNAPVCAPARTTLITGVYSSSTGGQHMRSDVKLPEYLKEFPIFLRKAGYYTTNNSKEDYNVTGHEKVWDQSSEDAHYRNRKEGQPFFAVFNFTESHEYALRNRTELPHHNPDFAPIPPYHPNTPEVRRDWAQYYHGITNIDKRVGEILNQLEKDGLEEETIVFFYSDHGSGMPGIKRWPLNRGLQVPLFIHVPKKYLHLAPEGYKTGGSTNLPVSFIDFAPTLLSMINVDPPDWMQGIPFMGQKKGDAGEYLYGFRDRMDERIDMVRSVRNERYVYIRNYMPHLIYGQFLPYMFVTKTTQVWQDLYNQGQLKPLQSYFWEPKPTEELYDLLNDPDETINLATNKLHREALLELRQAHKNHVLSIRDTGFLPEAEMHRRAGNQSIYEMAQDIDLYPIGRIFDFAEIATSRDFEALPSIIAAFDDEDPAIRYWAALGINVLGKEAYNKAKDHIRSSLDDKNSSVQVEAASVMINYGTKDDITIAVDKLVELAPPDKNGAYIGIAAMNVITKLDKKQINRIKPVIVNMSLEDPDSPERPNAFVRRLVAIMLDEDIY
ncbi:MAG: sulfatase-like hydrolase/transferase [Balneolales bacterium]